MSHTPGPWKVADRFTVWTDDGVGCEVARVEVENLDDDSLAQAESDARLIAAAPEMLAALKGLMELYASGRMVIEGEQDEGDDPLIGASRHAIAKAERGN